MAPSELYARIYVCRNDPNWNDEALKKCIYWDNPWALCELCSNYEMCGTLRLPPSMKAKVKLGALVEEALNRYMPETWFPPSDNIYTFDD